jgi:hypothetical protein
MRTSRKSLEEFFDRSEIWADICDELDMWIADNHVMLEDLDGTMKLENFKHHAAICAALRRVKSVGAYMMTDKSLQETEEKDDGKTE